MNKGSVIFCSIESGILNTFESDDNTKIDLTNMRKFHNKIKNELISKASKLTIDKKDLNLLDLAVGRGGDLFKWKANGIKSVIGIDNDKSSLFNSIKKGDKFDGAMNRLKSSNIGNLRVRYHELSVLDPNVLEKLNNLDKGIKYSIVSCQFAFHYFSGKELYNTLDLISSKLKPGGIFIGTLTDGDLVKLNNNTKLGFLEIKEITKDKYVLNIKSSDLNYFDVIQKDNLENYTPKEKLVKYAGYFDLELVEINSFYNWYNFFKYDLSVPEQMISFLNFSIVLRKIK